MLRPMLVVAALLLPACAMAQVNPGWTKSGTAAPPAATGNTGKVLETQNAGGYTYLRVGTAGGEQWIAVPESAIPTGANVTWAPGAAMQNFHSKTLNKTFPQILFSGGAQVVK